jgi:hypothetical protein
MEKATHLMTVRKGAEREERERERDHEFLLPALQPAIASLNDIMYK